MTYSRICSSEHLSLGVTSKHLTLSLPKNPCLAEFEIAIIKPAPTRGRAGQHFKCQMFRSDPGNLVFLSALVFTDEGDHDALDF
jgi:hypothetical protein